MVPLIIDYPQIDPVFFHLGPIPVRWYSLAYLFGILLAYLHCRRLAKRYQVPVSPKQFDDFLFWATLGVIVGGRVGFVLFYNPVYYLHNPLQIVQLWDGGMSFHGGLAGVALALILFCRANTIPLFRFADLLACAAPIGLFLGRIANFINGELWGRPADVPWAMVFPADPKGVPRHPSQLYEAFLEGLVLFALCNWAYRQAALRDRPGAVTGVFFLGYGAARFSVEFVREPDPQFKGVLDWITMGQILSLPMLAIGAAFLWMALRRPKMSPSQA